MKDLSIILVLCLIFGLFSPRVSLSQENYKPAPTELSLHHINIGFQRGFLVPHHEFMAYYQEKKTLGFKASIEKVSKGNWANKFSYASSGLEAYHTSLGSNETLGQATHLLVFSRLGLHSQGKGKFLIGGGIGLLTETFDLKSNYKNIAIGSRTNIAVSFAYSFEIPLTKKYSITPVLRFTHYSNAAFKLPNLGLNLVSAGLNLQWDLTNEALISEAQKPESFERKLTGTVSYGRNQYHSSQDKNYSNYYAGMKYLYGSNSKLTYGLGVDLGFNNSRFQFSESKTESDINPLKELRAGLSATVGIKLGRSEIRADVGFYGLDQFDYDTPVYQRIYVITPILSGTYLQLGIKSHMTRAETAEIGISTDIWKR